MHGTPLYAVKCSHCRNGYIGNDQCPICDGNGRVICYDKRQLPLRVSMALYGIVIVSIAIILWLIFHNPQVPQ